MMESGTKGAINYKMNHQKGPTGGDGTKTESDSQKCRSLVCDSTGIIIAEMVYRCMICNSVTDSITEAKAHYQMNHMEEDEEQEEDYKFSPSESMRYQSPYNQQQQQQSAASGRSAADHQNRQSSSSSFRNPLVPDVSLYEDNSPLPLKFGNNNNNNNNLMHNHNNNVLSYKGNHSGECGEHDSAWLTCSPCPHPSSLGPMEHGASQTAQGQMTATATNGSNTKSGYVNCAVCGVTRFYSWCVLCDAVESCLAHSSFCTQTFDLLFESCFFVCSHVLTRSCFVSLCLNLQCSETLRTVYVCNLLPVLPHIPPEAEALCMSQSGIMSAQCQDPVSRLLDQRLHLRLLSGLAQTGRHRSKPASPPHSDLSGQNAPATAAATGLFR